MADPTLDYMSLNGVESPNGTNSGFTNGEYFSLTITNNSGSTLNLGKMTGDFDKTTVFQQFQGRIFNTTTPGSVADDTITKLGATSGGTGLEQDEALLDGTSGEGGANWGRCPCQHRGRCFAHLALGAKYELKLYHSLHEYRQRGHFCRPRADDGVDDIVRYGGSAHC